MTKIYWLVAFLCAVRFGIEPVQLMAQDRSSHDLYFTSLPRSWDEGIPLANGMLGALIWQKDSMLRISIDRADLWDLRPIKEFELPQFSYKWVQEQVRLGTYDSVQKLFDLPYERDPAPTKIPAGALEINISSFGTLAYIHLDLSKALCEVKWKAGPIIHFFVDANQPLGWFHYQNIPGELDVKFVPPPYQGADDSKKSSSVEGQGLARLGYPKGMHDLGKNTIYYEQKGWDEFSYSVSVKWNSKVEGGGVGVWSISTKNSPYSPEKSSWTFVTDAMKQSENDALVNHLYWWSEYWSKSSITLPDTILESQWYREIYKFGSASREGSPPITLQSVWTADNGNLPPWKGDFHHDLNTQLSYWPGYTSNHLTEASVFTDWLVKFQNNASNYTSQYFKTGGCNYPGVSTLTGEPLGGWIQYAFSPTTSAWLAHHFYLQWKYSMDRDFLENEAYPFLFKMAVFVDNISIKDRKYRKLPISSSPEFFDNSIQAWFTTTTNYDLALIRWLYQATAEMAAAMGKDEDEIYWRRKLKEWPALSLSETGSLLVAPGYAYQESHRHFSHLMAIHPLGIVDRNTGLEENRICQRSMDDLNRVGTDYWCGYSYAWLGNLMARQGDGTRAYEALKTFATCFCLPNSFHVNGDQSGTGKSKFTYRPFTLEGNFAFASGVQEMLLQSHGGILRVFPAVPDNWKNISFVKLRGEGAFLVSAIRKAGAVTEVKVISEKGGKLSLVNPFGEGRVKINGAKRILYKRAGLIVIETVPGQEIVFSEIKTTRKKYTLSF